MKRGLQKNDINVTETNQAALPSVGLGTYHANGYECFNAVKEALEIGYRHVDTAMAYENEATVGRAIEVSPVDRDDVFLTTKIKGDPPFVEYDRLLKATDGCLDRLGTDYIDLLLIHWWNSEANMEETFAAMDRLVDEGKARHIGVSNFSVAQLRRAMRISDTPILTNQIEYHPYHDQNKLLRFCQKNNIILTAYSPLVRGRVVDDDVLTAIGDRYGKSPAQIAIRWLIQQENVVTIPKTVNPSHARDNLDVFDFELSGQAMARIADLEGPFWYRQNREGGLVYRFRGLVGPVVGPLVPKPVRERI